MSPFSVGRVVPFSLSLHERWQRVHLLCQLSSHLLLFISYPRLLCPCLSSPFLLFSSPDTTPIGGTLSSPLRLPPFGSFPCAHFVRLLGFFHPRRSSATLPPAFLSLLYPFHPLPRASLVPRSPTFPGFLRSTVTFFVISYQVRAPLFWCLTLPSCGLHLLSHTCPVNFIPHRFHLSN